MRFRFRLESILKLKTLEEETAKEELIRVRNRIRSLESELEALKNEKRNMELEMSRRLKSGMDGGEIEKWLFYIRGIEHEINAKYDELEDLKREEREKLGFFLEKQRERKALEKLKDRRFKEHLSELESRERKFLDEVAQRRHWWNT